MVVDKPEPSIDDLSQADAFRAKEETGYQAKASSEFNDTDKQALHADKEPVSEARGDDSHT